MTQLPIPDDIQILLDCVQERDDLALEEMSPLKSWIEQTPGGELALSRALAQNSQLKSAIAEMDIRVPKTLRRKVISYVRRNYEEPTSGDRPRTRSKVDMGPQTRWSINQHLTFLAGLSAGIAAVFLVGLSIQYISGLFGYLDQDQVALDSIQWIDSIDQDHGWKPYRNSASHVLPYEIKGTPIRMAEFDTKQYGVGVAYDLSFPDPVDDPNARGVLFVFETTKHYEHKTFGNMPDYQSASHQVGIAKNGNHAYVLNVEGPTSLYMQLIPKDYRAPPIVYLLRFAWFPC